MKRKAVSQLVVLIVLLGWICLNYFACEWTPERDNPLDPNSELYHPPSPGSITGEVHNLSGTSSLSGVWVSLESGGQGVVTASNGRYVIENVSDGLHWVRIRKDGYSDDSSQVSVQTDRIDTANFRMNALPVFDSVSVTLHRIYLYPLYDEYVTICARITDSDQNISTVTDTTILVLFEGDTLGKLNYSTNQITGSFTFGKDFPISDFSGISAQDIVGRPFTLIAIDQAGGNSISGSYSIVRYLDTPGVSYPVDLQTVSTPMPTLIWVDPVLAFSYFQNVRVFSNTDAFVWDSLLIAPTIIQVTVTDSLLPTGIVSGIDHYYWTLEIMDLFGNTGQSRKAKFKVQY